MPASAPSPSPLARDLVETLRALAGRHPGFRPAHAKGIVCSGTFRGSASARRVTRAAHFQGEVVPAIIRFSNANGDPSVHDGVPNVRAMSVKFQLAGGKTADILANSVQGFPVRTPEEFLAMLRAQLPDPATGKPAPGALESFLASHPSAQAFIARLQERPIPASYARTNYHAEHAFAFTAADGVRRFGRYRWIAEAGEEFLSPAEGAKRDRDFLRAELESRLRNGPVAFRLHVQLAEAGDPTDDVTALWPESREQVELGRLEITAISPTSAADEQRLVFDPANRADGIDLSGDPILNIRSAAYSVSFDRRSKGE